MSTGLFLDSSTRTGPISIACKACEPRRMLFLEILDLGSWVYPKISKKSFLEILDLGSWVAGIETMTLKSEVKSELKSELMSQETQYKKLSGNLGSWILGSRNRDYDTQV